MLQALRMAANSAAPSRKAMEVDVAWEDDGASLAATGGGGGGRAAPARHTLLHISCGGCEWCVTGGCLHGSCPICCLAGDPSQLLTKFSSSSLMLPSQRLRAVAAQISHTRA